MSTFLDTIPTVYQNETNNNGDGVNLNDREINNNLAIGTPLQDHPMPGFQNSRSFQYYVPPPQYCSHDQVCPQSSQTPNHYVDASIPCSCPNPQSSYYPVPPPDYQELSPHTISPLSQGCPPPLQNCSPCGAGVQWKWVGNGWAPVVPNLNSNILSLSNRRMPSLRNRKVEIVLWSFIIFLLIIIGVLSYSHMQLLSTLHESSASQPPSTTDQPYIPPMAHRPGASPINLITD